MLINLLSFFAFSFSVSFGYISFAFSKDDLQYEFRFKLLFVSNRHILNKCQLDFKNCIKKCGILSISTQAASAKSSALPFVIYGFIYPERSSFSLSSSPLAIFKFDCLHWDVWIYLSLHIYCGVRGTLPIMILEMVIVFKLQISVKKKKVYAKQYNIQYIFKKGQHDK